MNTFDTLVVLASIVEAILDLMPSTQGIAPLSVMRTLRFLRLARLVHSWKELQNVIHTLMHSVVSVAWMSLLMGLFMVIAALLGMQLFGYRWVGSAYPAVERGHVLRMILMGGGACSYALWLARACVLASEGGKCMFACCMHVVAFMHVSLVVVPVPCTGSSSATTWTGRRPSAPWASASGATALSSSSAT